MKKKKLYAKQKTFCEEWIIDKNGTQAAIRAGYSKKTAAQTASRLLINVKIQAYIAELIKKQSIRTQITADRVLEEIARLAFAKLSDVVEWEGNSINLKDSSKLKDDVSAAVKEISHTTGMNGTTTKIKMHNKESALEKLAKHLELYKDNNIYNGSVTIINDVPRSK